MTHEVTARQELRTDGIEAYAYHVGGGSTAMPTIDYDGSAGVFKHLGAIIARINSYQAVGNTTLPADLQLLLAAFGTTWLPEEGIASYYEGLRDSVTGWRQGLASFADRRLLDLETVTRPLKLQPGAGIEETLLALRKAMIDDAETVRSCLCTIGTPSYPSANRGNGRIWTTDILDGFNPPIAGGISDWSYDGKASELMVPSETMTLECVGDAQIDGLAEGGEAWRWDGAPDHGPLDVRTEGSGSGPGVLTGTAGYNLLSNPLLDSWSNTTTPSGWTRYGSAFVQSTDYFVSSPYSAYFDAGVTGGMIQTIPQGTLQARRRYFLGFSAFSTGPNPGASIRLSLLGTGFAPGSQAELDGASLGGGGWNHAGAFITVPPEVPDNLSVRLDVANADGLYVDNLILTPAVYSGGVGLAIQGGAVPWQKGDRATFTVTNDQAGKFQTFFRRWYRAQLPSVATAPSQGMFLTLLMLLMPSQAAETISESLVS